MILLLLLSLACLTYSDEGGYLGSIFNYASSAKYSAMGNSAIAISDDAPGSYYNPAVLALLDKKEFSSGTTFLFENTYYSYLIYAHPFIEGGCLSLANLLLHSFLAEKRDQNNNLVGNFDFLQSAHSISFGKNLTKNISWGTSIKLLNTSLINHSHMHISFDTGLHFTLNHLVSLGLTLQNLISTKIYGDTDDKMPFIMKIGSAYKLMGEKLLFALDVERNSTNKLFNFYSFGLQTKLLDFLTLRFGNNTNEFSAGFGISFKTLNLDYAIGLHHSLGHSHKVSFNMKFGKSINEIKLAMLRLKEEKDRIELERKKQEEERKLEEIKKQQQEKFNLHFSSAVELYKIGYYKSALDEISQALTLFPDNEDAKVIHSRLSDITPLLPQLIGPLKPAQLTRQAIQSYITGDFETSIRVLAYVLSLEPDNYTLNRLLTRLENKTGIKAEKISPAAGLSLVERKLYETLIEFKKKNYSQAIKLCEEVIEIEPDNVLAYKRLGSALFALGEKEKAKQVWEKALSLQPDEKLEKLLRTMK